jgi:putative ABC transport system permease protein
MVGGALYRQKGKMVIVAFTVALGASLATAMLNVMFDVGDKVNQELKTYGANINVIPQGASLLDDLYGLEEGAGVSDKYLNEDELGKLKTIFWAFNIVDFAPYLNLHAELSTGKTAGEINAAGTWFHKSLELPTGETIATGVSAMKNWWDVKGSWASDDRTDSAMIGAAAAERFGLALGDTFRLTVGGKTQGFTVGGIFQSGSGEDTGVYIPLAAAQEISGKPNQVHRVEVSALTTPDNELSRRAARDPKSLSVKEWETWYCTAYVSAICYQIDEVINGAVSKPIRQVAESEGAILQKTQLLMFLITIISMAASALGISNLVTTAVMERSSEIGLLKAVGASDVPVTLLILTEIVITGIIGGAAGYFLGLGFARIIGATVFGAAVAIKPQVIPLTAILVIVVTLAGSIPAVKLLLSLRPAEVLHGR